MKKPTKTLKEFGRLEKLLTKQTARSAKLLARRKTGDDADPATDAFYDRIAERHAAALSDLSEITRAGEALSLQIIELDSAKSARKAAAKSRAKAPAAKKRASNGKSEAPRERAPAARRTSRAPGKTAPA